MLYEQIPIAEALLRHSRGPIVWFCVGEAREMFLVPLQLLVENSLRYRHLGGMTRLPPIVLESLEADLFRAWTEWMRGNLQVLKSFELNSLYNLYFLAAELRSLEFQNSCIDQIRERYEVADKWPTNARISTVYAKTGSGSPLREFLSLCAWYRIMRIGEEVDEIFAGPTVSPDVMLDYIKVVQQKERLGEEGDPRKRAACRFHDHDSTDGH